MKTPTQSGLLSLLLAATRLLLTRAAAACFTPRAPANGSRMPVARSSRRAIGLGGRRFRVLAAVLPFVTALSLSADVNVNPSVSDLPASIGFFEDTQGNFNLSASTFIDPDSTNITVVLTASTGTFGIPDDSEDVATITDDVTEVTGASVTLSGTLAEVNAFLDTASNITYTPAADLAASPAGTVTVTANDGDGSGDVTVGTIFINIDAVNDAPSFTAGATLTAVLEDAAPSAGETIQGLLNSGFSDLENSFVGIAVAANAANSVTEGKWQYLPFEGDTWSDVGTVSTSDALLLDTSTKLRFLPVANFSGEPGALTVHAVDDSAGTPTFTDGSTRRTFNTDTDNATSSVSKDGVLLGTSITAVNDAPTLTATAENPTFVPGAATAKLFSGANASTGGAGQFFKSLTLTVTHVTDGADEKLAIDAAEVVLTTGNMPGVPGGHSLTVALALDGTTATVTITDPSPSLDADQLQAIVNGLGYYNTSATATATNARVVTITELVDNGGTENGVDTATLSIASSVSLPTVTSATYDAANGELVVTGANFVANGSGADVDASRFTFTGEGGATYALTDTSDVELDNENLSTRFTLTLSPTDKAAVNQILNKNGTSSTGGSTYNLAAADDYLTAVTAGNTTDGSNPITVSAVPKPTITGATYDVSRGVLTVTGTGFVKLAGATNDIDVSKLTVTGEGGGTRTLTSASVEITSGTTFSVTLNAEDQAALIPLLNKDGTNSIGLTDFNLAAAEDWAAGAAADVDVADATGVGITVSEADDDAPMVEGVTSSTATGSYKAGTEISIQVNFSEDVYVTGTPQLTLETGTTDRTIDYSGGSSTSSLTFTYTVQAGDTSTDLDYVADSLVLNDGTIKDLTGNNAVLTLATPGEENSLGANTNLVVDTTAPTISSIVRESPTAVHTAATSITYRVTFDSEVTGVDATDFTLTAPAGNTPASTATGTIASVTEQSAGVYDVVVNTVSGQGKARLDLKSSGTGIADLANNAIVDGFTTSEFYFVGATSVFDTLHLTAIGQYAADEMSSGMPAQRFTTAAGQPLTLTSVVAQLNSTSGTPSPVVTINANNAGAPGNVIGTLTNPSSLTAPGLNVWTGSVTLSPNTIYWIVFAEESSSYTVDRASATTGGTGDWLTAADYNVRWNTDSNTQADDEVLKIALGATSIPTITSTLTASGTYGASFSYQITATSTPTSYAATNLPSGLSLNTSTGLISGTPAQTGTFSNISLTATNGSGTSSPATLVLTISPASASVALASLTRTYTGQPLAPTITTNPSGLPLIVTYNGSTTVPTAVGSYNVLASVNDPNYSGSTSGVFNITKAVATVTLGNLTHTYDGTAKSATATTVPAGLEVTLSYDPANPTLTGSYTVTATVNAPNHTGTATGTLSIAPAAIPPPVVPTVGASIEISGSSGLGDTGQWQRNGSNLLSGTGSSLTLTDVQPPTAGLYTYTTTLPGGGTGTSEPVIVGLTTDDLVVGTGDIVGSDIVHPNGNVYDQVLLGGVGASVTSKQNKVTRVSFLDLTNDIVQVEFSGAGTLSVVMDDASQPAPPLNYNQENVDYVRGHVGLVITGADETSNISVFSVGPITAVNQTLFKEGVVYDGVADIAFVAIQSANGKFGGIRTGNVHYYASQGFTGVYAPGVEVAGPINIGEVTAFDSATPVLVFGTAGTVNLTGGNLEQDNGSSVTVSGITKVQFVNGTTSQNVTLPAQQNQGVLIEDGVDVTDLLVTRP